VPVLDRDFEDWIRRGVEEGWCGPPVCSTHDGVPTSENEDFELWNGWDTCVHVIRLYEDRKMKAAVESNHSPSLWRNRY